MTDISGLFDQQMQDKLSSLVNQQRKMMKFREHKDQSFVGELSQVSLDSFEQIFIKKQIEEIKKRYILEDPIYYEIRKGKFL